MKIVIEFSTDNSAFEDDFYNEIEDILDNTFLAIVDSKDKQTMGEDTAVEKTILDYNGNTVGTIKVCM